MLNDHHWYSLSVKVFQKKKERYLKERGTPLCPNHATPLTGNSRQSYSRIFLGAGEWYYVK